MIRGPWLVLALLALAGPARADDGPLEACVNVTDADPADRWLDRLSPGDLDTLRLWLQQPQRTGCWDGAATAIGELGDEEDFDLLRSVFERDSLQLVEAGADPYAVRETFRPTLLAIGQLIRRSRAPGGVEFLRAASVEAFWTGRPWLRLGDSGAIGLRAGDVRLATDYGAFDVRPRVARTVREVGARGSLAAVGVWIETDDGRVAGPALAVVTAGRAGRAV